MNKIKITIPDNLTPEQEILSIAKELSPKLLPSSLNLLGSGYEVKSLNTIIEVIRKPTERIEMVRSCPVCQCDFIKGKTLVLNYGGNTRKKYYCSGDCRNKVLSICGNRASKTRKSLRPVRTF